MKTSRVVLTGLVVLAVGVLVSGADVPLTEYQRKQDVLAQCLFDGLHINAAELRLGPMVHTPMGFELLVATAPDGRIVSCESMHDGMNAMTAAPLDVPPDVKVLEVGGPVSAESCAMFGYAATDVARLEIVQPNDEVIQASVSNGTYMPMPRRSLGRWSHPGFAPTTTPAR